MILTFIIMYFICGISWLIYCMFKGESLDLSDGIVPNWIVYSTAILFWWYWIYRKIKD